MNNQERIDDLQIKGYKIIQNPQLFCFGMDAVLLSAFARVGEAETALDLGCGNGIIPLLLAAKTKGQHFIGLEIQEESVTLAKRSIALNGLEDKIQVIKGDIKEASTIFGASSFSVITSNPPYMIGAHGLTSDKEALNIARHEVLCTLADVIREGSRLLKEKGRFYMVHRPFRLPEILAEMQKQRIEPKRMRLVYPYVHKEPNMVLIEGVKGGRPRMQVEPPLIVYEENGNYTKELLKLYGEVE